MRPIELTMAAFGSYLEEETIDFTKFYDKGIFLITGPTGAGKTTIFDGICYALYGRISNSDKDENYIRNDRADGNTLTYVELKFELGGKKYYIKRVPKQRLKKANGEGYTEKRAEAELKLLSDDGKTSVSVVSGVRDVNQKIVELVGLEYEQFKQIIMIPQGEFRQLLTAKSRDREEILRKIFGTHEYRKMQEVLDSMAKGLKNDIEKLRDRLNTNIKNINAGDNDKLEEIKEIVDKAGDTSPNIAELTAELKAQIDADEREIAELDKKIKLLEKEIMDIRDEITKGQQTNSQLEKRKEIEQQKKDLEAKKAEIEELEKALEKGRRALSIKAVEENYLNYQRKLGDKEIELKDLEKKLKGAKKAVEQAEEELNRQLERNKEADKLKEQIGLLNSLAEKVKSYDDEKNKRDALESQFNDICIKRDKLTQNIETTKKEIKELNEKKESLKDCEKDSIHLKIVFEKKKDIHKRLTGLKPLIGELDSIGEKLKKIDEEYLSLQKEYEALQAELEEARKKFIKGYAGKLAKELKEGEPCPVCGSSYHPSPAALVDGVPSEEELNELEARLNKLRADREEVGKKRDGLNNLYTAKKSEINVQKNAVKEAIGDDLGEDLIEDIGKLEGAELEGFIDEKALQFKKQLDDIKSALERLQKEIEEKEAIDKKLKELESQRESGEKKREELSGKYNQIYGELVRQRSLVEQLEKELPEDIRSEAGLNSEIDKLSNRIKEIEADIKKAQEKSQRCRDEYTALQQAEKDGKKALEDLKKEVEELKIKFEEQMRKQGFADEDEYNKAKLAEEELKRIEGDIKAYYEDLKSANDRFNEIVALTKDLEPVDIAALEDKLEEKSREKDLTTDCRTTVYSRHENNKKMLDNINGLVKDISKKENEYELVGFLSKIANGGNDYKVTFETYVLAAYFEEVLAAANIRLREMTRNRFQMIRADDEAGGRGYKGLNIDVYDEYSSQCRPIKNISGGESFKASLALALGLSDVVQSHAGGIKLDTMFIDEGFGSLDSDSLDDAINCLLKLQDSGRLVGIISHVKELQERIPSRIEVEPSERGSKTKCVI